MQITYDQIRKAVLDLKGTKAPIQRRWDFYRNDVDRIPYFPMLKDETAKHYSDRLKIPVGWCGAMANRIASYFRKQPIAVTFAVDGKEENPLAKEASDIWSEIASVNNYEPFMVDVARDAGVGGNAYTKERIAFFDVESGDEYKTGPYRGRIFIERVNEVFINRIEIAGAPLFIEAWERVRGQTGLLSDQPDAGKFEYIELIMPASHDPVTGKLKAKAYWVIWQQKKLIYGPIEIPFAVPIQRFANLVSRPASENGMSDIEWSIPLVHMVNHIFSGAARAVQYHGEPKVVFEGIDQSEVQWATDQAIFLPPGSGAQNPEAKFLVWDQNISGAKSLYGDGLDLISSISSIPKHMMHDLDNAGAVPSGVALRIMYEGMNQVCALKEAGFKDAEERMIKACLSQLAFFNGKAGRFDGVRVSIQYNKDRTPRDNDAEFQADMKRLMTKEMNLVDLVLKHEPGIKTREDAIEYLKLRAEENKQLQDLGVLQAPPTGAWADEQGGPGNQGDEQDDGGAKE